MIAPRLWGAVDIASRVWYFRLRRCRLWLDKFHLELVVLPPVVHARMDIVEESSYWRLQTPWFGLKLEGWDAKGRNIFA